jgi:hypothetical protein
MQSCRTDHYYKRQIRAGGGHHQEKTLSGAQTEGARFTTIHYEGTCPVSKETAVEGSIAAEVLTDPNNGTLGEAVERGEAKSWLINFPATPIKKIWLVKAGVGSEVSVGLLPATEEAKFGGTALVLLANEKHETEEASWGFAVKGTPKLGAEKVGGVGVLGGKGVCGFTAVGQKCAIYVENQSPVGGEEVEITKQEVYEFVKGVKTSERYLKQREPATGPVCEEPTLFNLFIGTKLSPGKLCTVEIELIEKAATEVKGGYFVEAHALPSELRAGATVVLTG